MAVLLDVFLPSVGGNVESDRDSAMYRPRLQLYHCRAILGIEVI